MSSLDLSCSHYLSRRSTPSFEAVGDSARIGPGLRRKVTLTHGNIKPCRCFLEYTGHAGRPQPKCTDIVHHRQRDFYRSSAPDAYRAIVERECRHSSQFRFLPPEGKDQAVASRKSFPDADDSARIKLILSVVRTTSNDPIGEAGRGCRGPASG